MLYYFKYVIINMYITNAGWQFGRARPFYSLSCLDWRKSEAVMEKNGKWLKCIVAIFVNRDVAIIRHEISVKIH